MAREKMNLTNSFNLKLTLEDKEKIEYLQKLGLNMSYEFRVLIRKLYKEQKEE